MSSTASGINLQLRLPKSYAKCNEQKLGLGAERSGLPQPFAEAKALKVISV